MVDSSRLAEDLRKIEAKYGADAINIGGSHNPIARIGTSSLELDFATGGGIPVGRFSRFYGGFSSGKSLTCWNVIRNAQEKGMTCVYYNIEKQYDSEFVASRGVDTDNLIVVQGTIIEEVGTKLETLLGSAHLHVLDSCSSAVSIDELNNTLEEWTRGLNARVWGKVLRRALDRFDPKENTVILVDQVRDLMVGMGGERPPGGRLMEHTSSLTLHFKRGKWLFRDSNDVLAEGSSQDFGGDPDGIEIAVRVQKSRVGRPFRVARMRLDLETMKFDDLYELVKAAEFLELVESSGSWFTLPSGEKLHGKKKLRSFITENGEFAEEIRDGLMAKA